MSSVVRSVSVLGFALMAACAVAPKDSGDTGGTLDPTASEGDDSASTADAIRQYTPTGEELAPVGETINGFSTGGFEYWPYKETPPLYPSKIQWGYDSGSEPAKKCMAAAFADLKEILRDPPPELVQLKEKYGIRSFFNWNNDMTDAPTRVRAQIREIWLYQGRLIKWISETKRDGTCLLPERSDLVAFAKGCLEAPSSCNIETEASP
jgi:hypothetical protein